MQEELRNKSMQETLRVELERQKREKSELERIEKQRTLQYGSETRNSDHSAIMAEM